MALLEALLLMSAQATAPPPKADPPPVELLEFLGDWAEDEGNLIDSEKPAERTGLRKKRRDGAGRDVKETTP